MLTATTDGRNVGYRAHGAVDRGDGRCDGEPIVLVHGSGCSETHWTEMVDHLGERRVVAVDLHGYGETDGWSGERPLALADEAELVDAVVETVRGPAHLVGHGYGGAVALRYALERRAQVRTLTLVEPFAFHLLAGAPALLAEVECVADVLLAATGRGDYARGVGLLVDYWSGRGAWLRLDRGVRRALGAQAQAMCMHFAAAAAERVPLEAYASLPMPTLLVQGARTRRPAAEIVRLLARTLEHARHLCVLGAEHMVPVTHPRVVADALAGLIASAPDGARGATAAQRQTRAIASSFGSAR